MEQAQLLRRSFQTLGPATENRDQNRPTRFCIDAVRANGTHNTALSRAKGSTTLGPRHCPTEVYYVGGCKAKLTRQTKETTL